jgi:hypothetical protein
MPSSFPWKLAGAGAALIGLATDYGARCLSVFGSIVVGQVTSPTARDFVFEYHKSIKSLKSIHERGFLEANQEEADRITDDLIFRGRMTGFAISLGGAAGVILGGYWAYQTTKPLITNALSNYISSSYHTSFLELSDHPKRINIRSSPLNLRHVSFG